MRKWTIKLTITLVCQIRDTNHTTDSSFKRVFRVDTEKGKNMVANFLDSLLKIEFPDKDLTTRNVQLQDESVNLKYCSANSASMESSVDNKSPEKPQKLEVDALFSAKVDGDWPTNKSKKIRMLVEMQVAEQDFGARLKQYAEIISGAQEINLSKEQVPDPVVGFGLCMWDEGGFTFGDSLESAKLHGPEWNGTLKTETRIRNIFLGKCKLYGIKAEQRTEARAALKDKVVKYFKK